MELIIINIYPHLYPARITTLQGKGWGEERKYLAMSNFHTFPCVQSCRFPIVASVYHPLPFWLALLQIYQMQKWIDCKIQSQALQIYLWANRFIVNSRTECNMSNIQKRAPLAATTCIFLQEMQTGTVYFSTFSPIQILQFKIKMGRGKKNFSS